MRFVPFAVVRALEGRELELELLGAVDDYLLPLLYDVSLASTSLVVPWCA